VICIRLDGNARKARRAPDFHQDYDSRNPEMVRGIETVLRFAFRQYLKSDSGCAEKSRAEKNIKTAVVFGVQKSCAGAVDNDV